MFVTRGHTTRVTFTVKFAYLSGRAKKLFLEKENIFSQKSTPQLLGHIGLQTMKV